MHNVMMVAALALLGCGGDDGDGAAEPRLSEIGESCARSADCVEGAVCIDQACVSEDDPAACELVCVHSRDGVVPDEECTYAETDRVNALTDPRDDDDPKQPYYRTAGDYSMACNEAPGEGE